MAMQAEDKSLSQLEREAEHTRADLIHTVDELHSRVSPQAIKDEVKAYARDTSQQFMRTIERRARENPLQAVAVAAGLAYPAWRFLMHIPAPVLLVGAGIALTQAGGAFGPNSAGEQQGEPLADAFKRNARSAYTNVSDTAEELKTSVTRTAQDATSAVRDTVKDMTSRAASAITDATDSVRTAAADTVADASQKVSAGYRDTIETASRTGDQLTEGLRQSRDTLYEAIETHPLIVGGIGLLIGAAIASALPVSRVENEMFGDTSNELKDRAREMASEGFALAKDAAEELYQESVDRAQQYGLKPDTVRETVKDVGEKVKDVIQQAVKPPPGISKPA